MADSTFAWTLFVIYALATGVLAVVGARRTRGIASFAVGDRDMGPGLVGLTLAASMASTATFVINPGFVYRYGVSALVSFTVPLFVGMFLGLAVLAKPFRRIADENGALTLPHWMRTRFRSRALGTWFAVIALFNVAYIVLIVVGSALVMSRTLGMSYQASVVFVVAFVFLYTMIGGTYAHVFTNGLQGALMTLVAVLVFASGLFLFGDRLLPLLAELRAADPQYFSLTYEGSPFFSTYAEVIGCAFVLGVALVTQPHLMTKALYLRSARDMRRFIAIGGGAFVLLSLVYFGGLYARLLVPGIERQDTVMAVFFHTAFPAKVGILVSVVVLAAAMSTLDGILVAVSSIVANDLTTQLVPRATAQRLGEAGMNRVALWMSRAVMVVLAVVALVLALDPPELVGIFGNVGVFAVLASATVPLLAGVYLRRVPTWVIWASALVGPSVHMALFLTGFSQNPALTATLGLLASAAPVVLWALASCLRGSSRAGDIDGAVPREALS